MRTNTAINLSVARNPDGFTISGGQVGRGLTVTSGDVNLVGGAIISDGQILVGNSTSNSFDQGYINGVNGVNIQSGAGFLTIGLTGVLFSSQTGQFYPASNPQNYSTSGDLTSTGITLYNLTTGLSGQSNINFYLRSNPSGFLSSLSGLSFELITDLSGSFDIIIQSTGSSLYGYLVGLSGQFNEKFYLNSNPSGYLASLSGLSVSYVTGISGALQAQIGGTVNLSGYIKTGDADLRYYPLSLNPSGYVTGDVIRPSDLFNTGSNLYNIITGLSGQSVNDFYSRSNPSGYLNTLSGLSIDYVTGVSGALQAQIGGTVDLSGYITTGNADLRYYPLATNPSGYLTTLSGVPANLQATGSNLYALTTGLSGQARAEYGEPNPIVYVHTSTISYDYSSGYQPFITYVTGNFFFTGINYTAGGKTKHFFYGDSITRTIGFPSGWNYIGSKPADFAPTGRAVLSTQCLHASETGVWFAWGYKQ